MVTHTDGSTDVTEGGRTDSFTVQLSRMPSAVVSLQLTADSDLMISTGASSPAMKTVTFTIQPADWATPRVVNVGAAVDTLLEGTETAHVSFTIGSNDLSFKALTGTGVGVTVTDGNYGLLLQETGPNTAVVEGGPGDSVGVALSVRPTAPVTLEILGGPDLRVAASGGAPAALHRIVFTPDDWNTPHPVTVTAIEDGLKEGKEVAGLLFRLTSADLHYNNLAVSPLAVLVADAAVPRGGGAAAASWAADLQRAAPAYDAQAEKHPAAVGHGSDGPW